MFTIQEIVLACKGASKQEFLQNKIRGVSIDSRAIKPGDLFIAIQGQRLDGHKFLHDVCKKGAAAVMISREIQRLPPLPVIKVADTTRALGELARYYRQRFPVPVIAITGSTGKTTTKEMLKCVLSRRFSVCSTEGTKNNHIGIPLTIFRMNRKHQAAIIEVGTNQPGDIAWAGHIVLPDQVIFTNIGESHLEKLKSPYFVFREKLKILKNMSRQGTVFCNCDDKYLSALAGKVNHRRLVTFSLNAPSDFRAVQVESDYSKQRINFKVNGQRFSLRTFSRANIYNALAAISCGRSLGVAYADCAKALANFNFPSGRQNISNFADSWLIDDTYNANPVSFRSAVENFSVLPNRGKKILVCADMLELGSRSARLHRQIGRVISKSEVDVVLGLGNMTKELVEEVVSNNGKKQALHFPGRLELHRRLKSFLRAGDAVLVKGSRGMAMEKTAEFVRESFEEIIGKSR